MQYVTTARLQEGMRLGSRLYDSNLSVLLDHGAVLNRIGIQRIGEAGYAGVYIDDDGTRDIFVKDILNPALRLETIRSVRGLLQEVERGGYEKGLNVSKVRQERIIMPILEALIENPRKFVDMIDLKPYNDYVYYHTANCVVLSLLLGLEAGLSGTQLYELGLAALLHDLGNIFIPPELLSKPGRLTAEEYETIKRHTEKGFEYMRRHFDVSIEACMGALHHHENYDGRGYPYGLRGEKISIYGRIISITDVFDAMISHRPYRQPMFHSTALEYLESNAGTVFDPALVKAFHNVVAQYPAGCTVQLNTGARCLVVENNPKNPARPKLRLEKGYSKLPILFDLAGDPNLSNVTVSQTVEA